MRSVLCSIQQDIGVAIYALEFFGNRLLVGGTAEKDRSMARDNSKGMELYLRLYQDWNELVGNRYVEPQSITYSVSKIKSEDSTGRSALCVTFCPAFNYLACGMYNRRVNG